MRLPRAVYHTGISWLTTPDDPQASATVGDSAFDPPVVQASLLSPLDSVIQRGSPRATQWTGTLSGKNRKQRW